MLGVRESLAPTGLVIALLTTSCGEGRTTPPLMQKPSDGLPTSDARTSGAIARVGSTDFGPVGIGPEQLAWNHPPQYFSLSPDGTRLFTLDDDAVLRSWDVDRRSVVWRTSVGTDGAPLGWQRPVLPTAPDRGLVGSVAVSPDGSKVATCSWGLVRVLDAASGERVIERTADAAISWGVPITWSCDSQRVFWLGSAKTRAERGCVVAWDCSSGRELRSPPLGDVCGIHPMPGGDVTAVVATGMGTTVVLDGTTLQMRSSPQPLPENWCIEGWSTPADARLLAAKFVGGEEPTLGWYDPRTHLVDASKPRAALFRIVCDGTLRDVVAWTRNPTEGVLDLATGTSAQTCTAERIALAAGGRRAAISVFGRVRVISLPDGAFLFPDDVPLAVGRFVLHPDGRRLFVPAADGTLREYDVATGRALRSFRVTRGTYVLDHLYVTADGRKLIGGWIQPFELDLESGELRTIRGSDSYAKGERDGSLVLVDSVGEYQYRVSTFDRTGLPCTVNLERAGKSVYPFRFSLDGSEVRGDSYPSNVIPAGATRTKMTWDTATGRRITSAARYAPRPRVEVDEAGLVFEIRDDETGATIVVPDASLHLSKPELTAITVEDQLVALGCADGSTIVIDRRDGRSRAMFRCTEGRIVRAAFVAGCARIVTAHEAGTLNVWDISAAARGAR